MTLCICQHEERHHQRLAIPPGDDNEAGKCDKIGCYCELFRPDLEDYTDIKFGPIEESPIEGFGEEEIDMWIGRGYQELKAQIAALTAERDALRQRIAEAYQKFGGGHHPYATGAIDALDYVSGGKENEARRALDNPT